MKRISSRLFHLFTFAVFIVMSSCSSSPEKQEATDTKNENTQASDLMAVSPAYDASKIDPSAPVVEVVLKTTGNTMDEMQYDQSEIRVKAGSTVKLKLSNMATDASMQHNFVLIEEGTADKVGPEGVKAGPDKNYIPQMSEVLTGTPLTGPGKESEITFPAPEKGSYDFICTYPGHYTKMHGKFIVE